MNAKTLLLAASVIILGAVSALPNSAAYALSADVSIDGAGGDKVSPDKTGSKDGAVDKASKDGTGSKDPVSKDSANAAAAGKSGKGEGHSRR